jgi:Bacterial regulatory helix-turn-helix protein, lysR family
MRRAYCNSAQRVRSVTHNQRGAMLSQIVGKAVLISTGMGWKSQIQSRPRCAYLSSCLVALRWEIFGALGTVGTVLYVLGGTFADIVWSAIAAVTVALLIATFRESDDVVSMRTMKHAWSGPRFFALAQRNGTPLRAAIIDEMDRDLVGHLPIICVARNRSFLAAALELGMSPSAISHAVRNGPD